MTKNDILKEVAKSTGISEERVGIIFSEIVEEMKRQLFKHKRLEIENFGDFDLQITTTIDKTTLDEIKDGIVSFSPSKKLIVTDK